MFYSHEDAIQELGYISYRTLQMIIKNKVPEFECRHVRGQIDYAITKVDSYCEEHRDNSTNKFRDDFFDIMERTKQMQNIVNNIRIAPEDRHLHIAADMFD